MNVELPRIHAEIDGIKTSVLKYIYTQSLQDFLNSEDLNRLSISFSSPNTAIKSGEDKPSWKLLKISWGPIVFNCRLQSFPGCCGYLVISTLYQTHLQDDLVKAIFKGIFNFANSLHYQGVFSSHITSSWWTNRFKDLFDDARETGINQRTGNMLVLFYKNINTKLPAQIYTLPKQPDSTYE